MHLSPMVLLRHNHLSAACRDGDRTGTAAVSYAKDSSLRTLRHSISQCQPLGCTSQRDEEQRRRAASRQKGRNEGCPVGSVSDASMPPRNAGEGSKRRRKRQTGSQGKR